MTESGEEEERARIGGNNAPGDPADLRAAMLSVNLRLASDETPRFESADKCDGFSLDRQCNVA